MAAVGRGHGGGPGRLPVGHLRGFSSKAVVTVVGTLGVIDGQAGGAGGRSAITLWRQCRQSAINGLLARGPRGSGQMLAPDWTPSLPWTFVADKARRRWSRLAASTIDHRVRHRPEAKRSGRGRP